MRARNTASAVGFGGLPRRMRLISFRSLVKNSLRGFATAELPSGLRIADIPVLSSSGKFWAALPSKSLLDAEGKHKRDVNGKPEHAPILSWKSRELADEFARRVVALVRASDVDLLDEEGGQ